jgi:type VI secretion system secreted protein Hcp
MPSTTADMYLQLSLKSAGKAKGESKAPGHEDEIQVLAWRWGASAQMAVGSNQKNARRSYRDLSIVKSLDTASTALLTALKANDEVSVARLTMRKGGGEPHDFFRIVLKDARVTSIDHSADETGAVTEVITLSFAKVEVEYHAQDSDGAVGPAHMFDDVV